MLPPTGACQGAAQRACEGGDAVGVRRGLQTSPADTPQETAQLRTELVLALHLGVVIVGRLLPGESVATVDEDVLDDEMLHIVRSISRRGAG